MLHEEKVSKSTKLCTKLRKLHVIINSDSLVLTTGGADSKAVQYL